MSELASTPAVPKGWTSVQTAYGLGLTEEDRESLESLLKRMAGEKARLEIRHFSIPDAQLADAVSLGSVVRLAPATCADRARWLVRHEAIHVLRTLQLLRAAEWELLCAEVWDRRWIAKFSIAQRYERLSGSIRIEEAVAEAFASWCEENPRVALGKRRLRDWTGVFYRRCIKFGTGQGFTRVEDIFYAIASGVVARRQSDQRRGPTCAGLASYILDSGPCLVASQRV